MRLVGVDTLTALFNYFYLYRVLDPPSTGVKIVSVLKGSTRRWSYIESGFNPNNISSWNVYEIKQPSIKNKFSKLSTIYYPLWPSGSSIHNQALLAQRRQALFNPLSYLYGSLHFEYLIGWYWNDEGRGNVVQNMCINGNLGGGKLPHLEIVNPDLFWKEEGFGNTEESDNGECQATKTFLARELSENCSIGQFIKRTLPYDDGFFIAGLSINDLNEDNNLEFGLAASPANNRIENYIENTLDHYEEEENLIDEWYFQFIDESGYLNIASSDGSLFTLGDHLTLETFDMERVLIGKVSTPSNVVVGDTLIFNNRLLTTAEWGKWYDFLKDRYEMSDRTW